MKEEQAHVLSWERGGEADAARQKKMATVQTPPTDADKSLQGKGVESMEIEEFLRRCEGRSLVQALAQARKEVYRCQMSLHQLAEERSNAGEGLGGWVGGGGGGGGGGED